MKKQIISRLLAMTLFGCLLFQASAQEGIGIEPLSSKKTFQQKYGTRPPALIELASPDLTPVTAEDERIGWPRLAVEIPVYIDMHWSGEWLDLPDGNRLWRLTIRAKGAQGLTLSYSEFQLPAEGLLHIYNKEKTQVLGAFSNFNNPDGGRFATALIAGEELTLEYYEPQECRGKARLVIDAVGYAYRSGIEERSGGAANDSLYINCPAGADWQTEKRGALVILMKFDNTNGLFWCNGALMNNTAEDLTPYVLTSYSFMEGVHYAYGSQPLYDQFVFYFNWEYDDCGGPLMSPDVATMTGCSLVAANPATDMLLLKISGDIPSSPHNPSYLGWDRSTAVPVNPVCIHTPQTSVKQIATTTLPVKIFQGSMTSDVTGLSYPGTLFWETSLEKGMPGGGSEGNALLNQNGHVVGINFLTGGGCGGNVNYHTRLSKIWSPANAQSTERLSDWLDPLGTGDSTLDHLTGCNNLGGPIDQLNKAVLGNLSKFISKELHGNYKILEQAYIRHQREIDLALTSDEPRYRGVRTALETVKEKGMQTFFRAFIFEKENVVTAEDLATWKHLLEELAKVIGSASFTKDMQKVSRLLDAAADKDLKSALIAFDRATTTETSAVDAQALAGQLHTALTGNPGVITTLQYELPESGSVEITLSDLNGATRRTLLAGDAVSGSYSLVIEKQDLPPGIYFVRCSLNGSSGRLQSVQKLMIP